MLSRGANPSMSFHGKKPAEWANENGDETLATLVERVEMMMILCSPRTVPRLCGKKPGIETLPKELQMRLMAVLFGPLLKVRRRSGDGRDGHQ